MHTSNITIGLVGNPNSGKTSLFNALTGARQKVGNWPGVTVERKTGSYSFRGQSTTIVDLPGTYSLDAIPGSVSLDEQIAQSYVLSGEADLIVNIIDASNLERNLYLTTQLLEMQVPMVVALNMVDLLDKKGIEIDAGALATKLNCPVIPVVASQGEGLNELREAIATSRRNVLSAIQVPYPEPIVKALSQLESMVKSTLGEQVNSRWVALKLLEGDEHAKSLCNHHMLETASFLRSSIEVDLDEEIDVITADARFMHISSVAEAASKRRELHSNSITARVDKIVLSRIFGIPIFFLMMYLMFMFTINLGGAFIDFFDILTGTLFVDGFAEALSFVGAPEWLVVLLATGIGGGIQTVATFVPIIAFLFLFLSFMEDSGYMARATFVIDRFMRWIGLPGKAFVPLIVGFGCNVPAIMAARTLESHRDRLMTMAMAPFMSCGARLPVYALFAAAFFPNGGQNLVFLLYLIGIVAAVLTGLALKHTLLPGESSSFVMELPPYHRPTVRGLATHTWGRLKDFVLNASKIIVPMVFILNVMNSVGTDGSFGNEGKNHSVLSVVGQTITPAFAPLGISKDNWPAAVGIFTGVLAKEAVVGTLDTLYAQQHAGNETGEEKEEEAFSLWSGMGDAFASIPEGLSSISDTLLDPLSLNIGDVSNVESAAEEQEVAEGTFGTMIQLFGSTAAAFAYLLLILLYFPCTAVVGAVYREAGMRWTLFVSVWSTSVGYGLAVLFYQAATFQLHPLQSLAWIGSILTLALGSLAIMRLMGRKELLEYGAVAKAG